jgi:hypothetical protein
MLEGEKMHFGHHEKAQRVSKSSLNKYRTVDAGSPPFGFHESLPFPVIAAVLRFPTLLATSVDVIV